MDVLGANCPGCKPPCCYEPHRFLPVSTRSSLRREAHPPPSTAGAYHCVFPFPLRRRRRPRAIPPGASFALRVSRGGRGATADGTGPPAPHGAGRAPAAAAAAHTSAASRSHERGRARPARDAMLPHAPCPGVPPPRPRSGTGGATPARIALLLSKTATGPVRGRHANARAGMSVPPGRWAKPRVLGRPSRLGRWRRGAAGSSVCLSSMFI